MMLVLRLFAIGILAVTDLLLTCVAILMTQSSCGVWYIDLMTWVIACQCAMLVVIGTCCIVAIVKRLVS